MGECCPFQEAIDLLSRRHAMTIVWFLDQNGRSRFNDIKRSLEINPVSLSQRLADLQKAGVVSRKAFKETPPRVEYTLTGKGMDLVPLMDRLGEWASKHAVAA
ncbi:MAG TPA: helix-turn-helix domain-containing protein [Candidatus Thermoplasmatota archaeon]|nr:helix-turn-helix domain-containing protein [Candidatus Thermoplasmatota archaeon]